MFKIKNEQYEGPLDLLLQLIEKEKLDITSISLSKITSEYLEIISEFSGDSSEIADFLIIASKLLYIKSKELIPGVTNQDEEAEIEDLEKKLQEYQRYKLAANHLAETLSKERRSFNRRAKHPFETMFKPPTELKPNQLLSIFNEVISRFNEENIENVEIKTEKKISINEKRDEIRQIIKSGRKLNFKDLLKKSKNKTDVIITFLAILEMIKRQELKAEQTNNFGDINLLGVK